MSNDTQKRQRRQSAIKLRRISTPSPAADETQIIIAIDETMHASRACYRIIFLSAAVRIATTLIQDEIWMKLFDPHQPNHLTWADYVELFDSATTFICGLSMWYCATFHERNKTSEKDEAQQQNDNAFFFTLMFWLWGISAVDLALCSLAIASALPTIGFEGSFHSKLIGAESTLTMIVGTIIVLGYSTINICCTRAAMAEDEKDNERITQFQRDSKNRPHFKQVRELGRKAYCSIMLCAGSCLLYAFMGLSKWLVADKGTIAGGMMLFDVVDPFVEAFLITKLSGACLRLISIHREWSKESHAKDAHICVSYFNSYTSFYQKRTDVLNGVLIAKVCDCAAPYTIPHSSALLQSMFPTLYNRVFG